MGRRAGPGEPGYVLKQMRDGRMHSVAEIEAAAVRLGLRSSRSVQQLDRGDCRKDISLSQVVSTRRRLGLEASQEASEEA